MKLHLCCAAALLSIVSAGVDVERTVQQVQNILQENSQLPRLSREEILQLLNDIRAEDARSKSSSQERDDFTSTTPYSNLIDHVNESVNINDNIVADENEYQVSATVSTIDTNANIETTTKSEPSVMVVLPYTPRDGSSLQELYTRPPRVKVVPESKVTPTPITEKINERFKNTLKKNAQLANIKKQQLDISHELQAFLDSHGLKGKPGQDNFLLPLEGFKPLPSATTVDGTMQLPENILLSYDLIPSDSNGKQKEHKVVGQSPPTGFLYEPLRPEFPFDLPELDTSSSETKKSILPLDVPQLNVKPNYAPIDYDSVKVIPLNIGPNPLDDEKIDLENDLGKRQTNTTTKTEVSSTTTQDSTTTSPSSISEDDAKTNAPPSNDSASADSDTGASLADLEESFGGAALEQPGDSELPPPRKNGFYWMLDWNSFLEVGDGDTKVNIRFEPKLGDPQMFLPVNVP